MEITLTIWLTAELAGECTAKDSDKISISAEHETTKEDLNEFARDQGYADYQAYFKDYIDDEEELKTVISYVEEGKAYLVESEIEIDCKDGKAFHDFLLRKYQNELLANFMKEIADRCADFTVEA